MDGEKEVLSVYFVDPKHLLRRYSDPKNIQKHI